MSTQLNTINPFAKGPMPDHISAGAVMIESDRAVAEAQGKLVIAKRFPRDQARAYQRVMESCSRPTFAASSEYAFPRGGKTVRGPSIRLAEELARCWGNLDYGIRELSRKDGVSEMEAYAWDLETNTISAQKFTVRHIRDTTSGGKALSDERDIYELTANQGGRRLRARILAILPPDLVDAAVEKCRETLAGNSAEPIIDRVRKMLTKFSQYGITETHLSQYLEKSLDQILPTDLADLASIFNSIRSGAADASEFFGARKTESAKTVELNARLTSETKTSPDTSASAWPKAHPETGELLDIRGIPWIDGIHSTGRTCNADGTWRRQKGISPEAAAAREVSAMSPPTENITFDQVMRGIEMSETREQVDEWLDLSLGLDLDQERRAMIDKAAEARLAAIDAD